MKKIWFAAAAMALLVNPVHADEAADCQAGLDVIKAEIAKAPAKDVLDKLTKLLGDAEREAAEKEYEECFEAIEDAKEAAGG